MKTIQYTMALVCAMMAVFAIAPLSAHADYPAQPCSSACGDAHEGATKKCERELDSCNRSCGPKWDAACNDMCSAYWCACLSRACDAYAKCASESKCKRKPYFSRDLCSVCYKDR